MPDHLPEWVSIRPFSRSRYVETLDAINRRGLRTVCMEADCPNRYECFSRGTATFMVLGDTCTRNCLYCGINKGLPEDVDENEPERIAQAVKELGLNYAVITCVTRDDLEDCGAEHFVKTVNEIRKINPLCRIELLISDLKGNWEALRKIIGSRPDVLNHNIEVVKELFPVLRPRGNYDMSLQLLKNAKKLCPEIKTKSGLMLGFGEDDVQITNTMKDLKRAGCDIVTIGQYLQPGKKHFGVKKYYSKEEFNKIAEKARQMGIEHVSAGPLVRSSYRAGDCI